MLSELIERPIKEAFRNVHSRFIRAMHFIVISIWLACSHLFLNNRVIHRVIPHAVPTKRVIIRCDLEIREKEKNMSAQTARFPHS